MKIILAFMLFLTSFGAVSSENENSLAKIRAQLLKHSEIIGDFKQIKTVKDLKLSLDSEGQFRFKTPLNLNWNQKKPFISNLVLTPEKMVQTIPDGSEQIITKENQPIVFTFAASFLGIFTGDEKAIGKNFNYKLSSKGKKWSLVLDPKEEILKKLISEVRISGSEFVETIQILEKTGNSTDIQFKNVKGQ